MADDGFDLDWRGDEVGSMTFENVARAMSELALTVEGEAKKELRKGHGVETGTLRRSIHTALPGYNWSGDDIEPSRSTPNLGNQDVIPEPGGKMTVEVGSGLVYAMAVHQGHHNFTGYHYLTNGLKKAKNKLSSILERNRMKK